MFINFLLEYTFNNETETILCERQKFASTHFWKFNVANLQNNHASCLLSDNLYCKNPVLYRNTKSFRQIHPKIFVGSLPINLLKYTFLFNSRFFHLVQILIPLFLADWDNLFRYSKRSARSSLKTRMLRLFSF